MRVAFLMLLAVGSVHAQAKKDEKKSVAAAAKPGAETLALRPLVGALVTAGTVKAGAYGPGTPEAPSKGKHTCKWMVSSLWLDCEIEDTVGTGDKAIKWIGHGMVGWDFEAKGYRAAFVDNMGMSSTMAGKLSGSKLVWESLGEMTMGGQAVKSRVTLDWSDPKAIKFTEERQVGRAAPWMVAEESVMKPAK